MEINRKQQMHDNDIIDTKEKYEQEVTKLEKRLQQQADIIRQK